MTLASVVAIASANAADMYRAPEGVSYKDTPVFETWAGPYVGINGGYAWGNNSVSCDGYNYCDRAGIQSSANFASTGWFGGGQIGYNWQPLGHGGYKDGPASGNFLFGIEADIQGGYHGFGNVDRREWQCHGDRHSRLVRHGARPCWLHRWRCPSLRNGRRGDWRSSRQTDCRRNHGDKQ